MNVPNEVLDRTAARLFRQQGLLAAVLRRLREANVPGDILADLEAVQNIAQVEQGALVRAGAADPLEAARADTRERMRAAGFDTPEPGLRLVLSTPRAVTAVDALEVAAQAYIAWDEERGIEGGIGEVISDYAASARQEVFGPVELFR